MKAKLKFMMTAACRLYKADSGEDVALNIINPVLCHGIEFADGEVTLVHNSGSSWRIDTAYKEDFETFDASTDEEALKIFIGEIENWHDRDVDG